MVEGLGYVCPVFMKSTARLGIMIPSLRGVSSRAIKSLGVFCSKAEGEHGSTGITMHALEM